MIEASNLLPDERPFVGYNPGFVDNRILVVTGGEQWAEQGTHLRLGPGTLQPIAVPLGDGSWLTPDQETVQRWTTSSGFAPLTASLRGGLGRAEKALPTAEEQEGLAASRRPPKGPPT
ncbi:hypothetical protein ACGFZK_21545 [Streptomyces sp. NPDC048257]|uniref:hypothetical protein n=1 Tax=Streptomyces sp. NPDC048257 TaxID=3365526 RepID=UPI003712DB7D